MSAVQVDLHVTHTCPAHWLPHLTCLRLPACHRHLCDSAGSLLCDSAWAISVLGHGQPCGPCGWGLSPGEAFHQAQCLSSSLHPKLFWKHRLPPEPAMPPYLGPLPGVDFSQDLSLQPDGGFESQPAQLGSAISHHPRNVVYHDRGERAFL